MITFCKLISWTKTLLVFVVLIYFPIIVGSMWYFMIGMETGLTSASLFKLWSIGFFAIALAAVSIAILITILLNTVDQINKKK